MSAQHSADASLYALTAQSQLQAGSCRGTTPFLEALAGDQTRAMPKWWNAAPTQKRDSLDCVERVLDHSVEDAFSLPARPTQAVVDEVNRAMAALFDPEREKERLQAALHRALTQAAELEKGVARLQDENGPLAERLEVMTRDRDEIYRRLDHERISHAATRAEMGHVWGLRDEAASRLTKALDTERAAHAATRARAVRAEATLANILTAQPMRSNAEHHGGHDL